MSIQIIALGDCWMAGIGRSATAGPQGATDPSSFPMHGDEVKPSCAPQTEGCNNVSSATHFLDVLSASAHLHIFSLKPPSITVVHHDLLRFVRHTMRTGRLFLNRLEATPEPQDVVVVIDVLRSFSTAAYAFTAGAAAIHPVETAAEAIELQQALPQSLTTGAVPGGDPVPGFDFGNSPAALAGADLQGRELIQTTAAGVRGLLRFANAPSVFAGSLVCARATADAIRRLQPRQVTLLITGEWADRDGDEDVACADYLEALLAGGMPDPAPYEERVRRSDFGRRFAAGDNPSLPLLDLDLCARADCFDFAMLALRRTGRFVLLPLRSGELDVTPLDRIFPDGIHQVT